MKTNPILDKLKVIVLSMSIIAISTLIYGGVLLFTSFVPQGICSFLFPSFSIIFSMIILPYFLFNKSIVCNVNYKKIITYITTIIFFIVFLKLETLLIFYIAVGFSEEFLFRVLILDLLKTKFNFLVSIIINSILLAMVLHLNYSFIDNLLIRFPLSMILCIIYQKYGYENVSAIHGIYNIVIFYYF